MKKIMCILLVLCFLGMNVDASSAGSQSTPNTQVFSEGGLDISEMTLEAVPEELLEDFNAGKEENPVVSIASDGADDLNTVTVNNADGSHSVFAFAEPIKYVDEENKIKFIDNSLQEVNALSGLMSGSAYVNEENEMSIRLPKNIQSGVTVAQDDYEITMKPYSSQSASPVKKDVDALGAEQETVEYADALGEGVTLQYAAINSGLKESIVLEEYTGQSEFSFEIKTKNLACSTTYGGIVSFLDPETDEMVFQFNRAWAIDSYAAEEDDGHEHFNDNFTYTVEPLNNSSSGNSRYRVTLSADKEWLADPNTVYPVVIDPTVTHGYQDGNLTYTTVFSATTTKWPSSSYEYTQVGYRSGYGYGLVYIQLFDMSAFDGITPEMISRASVNMRQTYGNSKTYVVSAYDSNTSVGRDSATYATLSANIGTHLDDTTCSTNATYGWDIQRVFRSWLSYERAGNGWTSYQVMLKTPTNSTSYSYKQFYCSYSNLYIQVDYQTFLDGIFYIKNANSGKYLDAEWYPYAGANVSQYQFTGNVNQLWEVHYQGNDQYVLYPKVGDRFSLGLSANSSNVTVQTGNSSSSYQRLKLIRNDADGTYRIISNATGKAFDVANASTANGANVLPYTYYGNANQKWYLEKVDDYTIWDSVPQIGQYTYKWCWVASAQMIAEHYVDTVTISQTQAVEYVKGGVVYAGGTNSESVLAAQKFMNDFSVSFNCQSSGTLTEDELINCLKNGHPIYLSRFHYTSSTVSDSGHATVVYGYVTFNGVTRFLIRDPWPNENEDDTGTVFGNVEGSNYTMTRSEICFKSDLSSSTYPAYKWNGYYYKQ